ncbi:hypothetical protein AAY473_025149 [Plecturocebus cupreus]
MWSCKLEVGRRLAKEIGLSYVAQAGLEHMTSSDPLTSTSQSAGIIGGSHPIQLRFLSLALRQCICSDSIGNSSLQMGTPLTMG